MFFQDAADRIDRTRRLVGDDDIGEYIDTALEAFETDNDALAGVVAISIMHRFRHKYGEVPLAICEAVATEVVGAHTTPNDILYMTAFESHPAVRAALLQHISDRITHHASASSLVNDPVILTAVNVLYEASRPLNYIFALHQLAAEAALAQDETVRTN